MLGAFTFNTTENLPIGLLALISADLRVSPPAVGHLVSGYGLTVAIVSLPVALLTRGIARRYLLSGLLAVLVLASLASTLVTSYEVLLAARVATAAAQALFWAVMGPVAVGLFPPRMRGRVIGVLSVGGSLASVLGVPAGAWLGRHSGWQAPFLGLGGLALVSLVIVAGLLPASRPEEGHAARGLAPDARRFAVVLATTVLSATGAFAGFTYVVTFLAEVSGMSGNSVSALLLVFGIAGVAAVTLTGPLLDRFPLATLALPVAGQAVALLALSAAGDVQAFLAGGVLTVAALALLPRLRSRAELSETDQQNRFGQSLI
ncbi:MFS transporter [Nonomuraea zeae]|uniref:MFS transporter n=2 Tax=Nonomuraea zeae TaxID=1642303 RepID=A0A5S4H003_9ACTN|nr:MFS transporter [Nonomuraea zeae]